MIIFHSENQSKAIDVCERFYPNFKRFCGENYASTEWSIPTRDPSFFLFYDAVSTVLLLNIER